MSNDVQQITISTDEAVKLLQRFYRWNESTRLFEVKDEVSSSYHSGQGVFAIAGSDFDQYEYLRMHNPLWEIVRWMPTRSALWSDDDTQIREVDGYLMTIDHDSGRLLRCEGLSRNALCLTYAFAIISPGDLDWIVRKLNGRPIIELGAGRGYWSYQLEQVGIDVVAYEPHVPGEDNEYMKVAGQFTHVRRGEHTVITDHQDRVLMMVWPPYGSSYPAEALRAYTGDTLIYCGEGYGGCTANDDFYELLQSEWEHVETSNKHITYYGIRCTLDMWKRRDATEK